MACRRAAPSRVETGSEWDGLSRRRTIALVNERQHPAGGASPDLPHWDQRGGPAQGDQRRAWRASMADARVKVQVAERRDGRIAHVTVDNAKKLNSLSTSLILELTSAFAQLATDRELRAVVLTGA